MRLPADQQRQDLPWLLRQRKRIEMRFAHLKVHHHFERMRLRGLTGARDEFQLAATVQNLKTIASHLWRPPPNHLAHCAA